MRRLAALGRHVFSPLGSLGPHGFAIALGLALAVAPPPAAAQPPNTHEISDTRPSGFWTSNRPAAGGAYRWRLLGIGTAIVAATGYGMLRLVRRASAERTGRR